jgi:hypothetical protein
MATSLSNVVWGNFSIETVQADLDMMSKEKAIYLLHRALNWFDLGGAILLESSKKEYVAKKKGSRGKVTYRYTERNYLAVFDRPVSWIDNVAIMNWIALESKSESLKLWVRMQCIKKSSTVRLSPKGSKPMPRIVYHIGSQNQQIKKFLETRRFILDSLRRMRKKESVESNSLKGNQTDKIDKATSEANKK